MDLSFMQNEIVLALCWTLIHSLWQGLLLATVTGAVMIGTRRSSAGKRYKLLTGLFFVFMAVTAVTFIIEYKSIAHTSAVAPPSSVTNIIEPVLQVVSFTESNEAINKPMLERFKDYFNTHASLIVMIWFVVFIARFIRLTANLAYVHRLKNYKTFAPPAEWNGRLNELVVTLGLKKKIQLLESGVVKVPVVMGMLKPVVLLPLGLLAHLPADEIEAILLHELAHIKRRDYLVNLLQNFAETIFFFNPALMWVSSMIREERENCCDDIAISVTNNKSRFINALIAFQEYNFSGAKYNVGFAGRKNQLLNRVKRIINEKNKTLNAAEKSLLTFGMGVFILFSFAAAKKITPPAVRDVLSSLEMNQKKSDVRTLLPFAKSDLASQKNNHAETVGNENTFSYEPVRHETLDTGSGNLINSKGYAMYGEVVKYIDLVNDTTPAKEKKVPVKLSGRAVYDEVFDNARYRDDYRGAADSISGLFTNISTNIENDNSEITATHKDGTQYMIKQKAGLAKQFFINGKKIEDTEPYKTIISQIEQTVEYRRERSRERQEVSREHREKMAFDKKQRIEERKQVEADNHQRAIDRQHDRIEMKLEKLHLTLDTLHRLNDKKFRFKLKNGDSIFSKEKLSVKDVVLEKLFVKDVVLGKEKLHDKEKLLVKEVVLDKERLLNKEKQLVKEMVLDKEQGIEKKQATDAKLRLRQKLALEGKETLQQKVDLVKETVGKKARTNVYDMVSKENARRQTATVADSLRKMYSQKAIEASASKREAMRIREDLNNIQMNAQAQKLKEIIGDLEKEGVKMNLETSWLALDKEQFIVDGKTMPKEIHEKFIAKYVTSADGWGYYYGPIQVRGRGIFLDYKDLVRK
jgi:beta-lactamase regulating signal transducer with metallopeptidase domain